MGMETAAAPSTNRRLASVAAHLRPEQRIGAAPLLASSSSAAELQWAPLSPSVPWGRLLTSSAPLVELAADERHASAMREQLLEHGVLCLRPVGDAADVLPEPADFVAIMAALNPAAEGTAEAIERMKTFESTPADTNDDAEDPVALDCPKAHAEGFPNVRLLGDERDDSGRTKQLLCETGYEWHTDNVGPSHTALLCRSPLASGGETLFTSAARMYTELSEEQREKLHSLTAVHSNRFTAGGPSAFDCAHGLRMNATGTAVTRGSHTKRPSWTLSDAAGPLVERHSVTGVPYLVCVAKNLDQIEGMSVEESRATLHELMLPGLGGEPQVLGTIDEETGLTTSRTVFNPDFVYAHEWRKGDIVVWDNETMLHSTSPIALYEGGPRVMFQIVQDSDIAEDDGGMEDKGALNSDGKWGREAGGEEEGEKPRLSAGASHLRMTKRNRRST